MEVVSSFNFFFRWIMLENKILTWDNFIKRGEGKLNILIILWFAVVCLKLFGRCYHLQILQLWLGSLSNFGKGPR